MKRIVLPILALLYATSIYGQDAERVATQTRIAKQSATETGDRGLFTVPSAETLNKGQYSAGFGWSNTDRTPRDLDINSLPAFFSYGLFGRLTVTGTFETQRQIAARNLSQPGFNNTYPFVSDRFVKGYGDTILGAKYRFQRKRDNIGGISIKGFVKLPTADEKKGLGTGGTDVGADVIFTSMLPLKFIMHSTMAFTSTSDVKDPVTGLNRGIKDEMRSGLGAAWPASGLNLLNGTLQGIFEYNTVTSVGAGSNNLAAKTVQNPNDIAAGIRFLMLDSGLTLNAGYRFNKKFDFTFPGNKDRRGLIVALSYTKPVRPPGNNRFPVVSLESSAEQIRVGGSATITATGYDADNDQLAFSWMTSGGQIVGSGDKVTFNATGLAPGKYTIRATATDGKGGTATSLIDVTVTQ